MRLLWPAQRCAATAVLAARRHWLLTGLLAAGLVLRVFAQLAYRPALLYIDSLKYLYGVWANSDPLGYTVPLRLLLAVGHLELVTAVQHLLGLAMAVTLYLVLTRRGAPRWLAALATAPVLLDAYQLQMEQTIMPDTWFEALVAGCLSLLLWWPLPRLWQVALAGLLLGASATFRQVGEILLLPAVGYVVIVAGGRRRALAASAALTAAFALPIVSYMTLSLVLAGRFWLSHQGVTTLYGRAAAAADCPALALPASQRPLCPSPAQQALGPDWLDHAARSPLTLYRPVPGLAGSSAVTGFDRAVLTQQPLNVVSAIARDAVRLFSLTRRGAAGDPPLSRWQFQASYPTYGQRTTEGGYARYISISPAGSLIVGLNRAGSATAYTYQPLSPSLGGKVAVIRPLAGFLRSYQLNGGYLPGPVYLVAALAGLAGSFGVFGGDARTGRELALACLLFFATAAALLLMSDVFEFSWRYQLPALVTLVPAGALGLAVLLRAAAPATAPAQGAGLTACGAEPRDS